MANGQTDNATRDLTERTITAVIQATARALTAGSIRRAMLANGARVPSRSTVQRILDRMVANGAIGVTQRTIVVNGYDTNARHYHKRTIAAATRCDCAALPCICKPETW